MTDKLDRRKKYTRKALKESLVQLLKVKPVSAITVKEICENADINRSTFYSHFADQYDLLNQIEQEILSELTKTLSSCNYSKEEDTLQMTTKLLEFITENKDICKTLLSDHGDPSFHKKIMTVAHESTVKKVISSNIMDSEISEYVILFAISGSINVIRSWLEKDTNMPPKEMAEIILRLTNKGLSSFS